MAQFAPGTQQFDIGQQNAAYNRLQRRQDIAGGLMGLGGVFNTLANVSQRNQTYADQQAAMPYMMRALQNPTGSLSEGMQGPTQTPAQAAAAQASNYHEPSLWENMGLAFGVGRRQGNITPQAVSQIAEVQRGQNQERRLSAAEAREAAKHPFAIAQMQDEIQTAGIKRQQMQEEFPLDMEAKRAQIASARAHETLLPAQEDLYRAEAEAARAHAGFYKAGGAGGQRDPRWDILDGKIRAEQQKLTELSDAYRQRWDIDNGKVPQSESPLNLNIKYGGLSGDALRELMTQSQQLLGQYQREGQQLQGATQQAAPQGTQVNPVTAQDLDAGDAGGGSTWDQFLQSEGLNPHDPQAIQAIPQAQWNMLKSKWRGAGGR